jgi:hypothetical protein
MRPRWTGCPSCAGTQTSRLVAAHEASAGRRLAVWSALSACSCSDNQAFACLCMRGRGRKLVAIQTEAHACQQQSLAACRVGSVSQNFVSKIDASYADADALRFRRSLSQRTYQATMCYGACFPRCNGYFPTREVAAALVCVQDQCATRSRRASVSEESEEYEWFCSVERTDA